MSDTHGIARDQLRAFIERIERLSEEAKTIADDIRDVKAEAKSMGFSVKAINEILKLRKKDENERAEEEAILNAYKMALGMIPQMDMFHGDDDQPEAPVAKNKPSMALQSPRKAAEAVSERTAINQPETATMQRVNGHSQHEGANAQATVRNEVVTVVGTESGTVDNFETCERCQGNGEIVTDWDRYKHPHEGDIGDEAVADCPDCGGEGIIDVSPIHDTPSIDSAEAGILAEDTRSDANTGGSHVDDTRNAATHQAGVPVGKSPAAILRPDCLRPENCAGHGSTLCHACRKEAQGRAA